MQNAGRRAFIGLAALAGAGIVIARRPGYGQSRPGCSRGLGVNGASSSGAAPPSEEKSQNSVSAIEDLMQEHGLLERLLLVYEACARRIEAGDETPREEIAQAASIVRRFVEDYHEKSEEDAIFPRFERAGTLVDLARVLRAQHDAGRKLTDRIREITKGPAGLDAEAERELAVSLRAYARIFRPHAAREDTVLFPAFRKLCEPKEYDAIGETFEDKERALFGEGGFERIVGEVAQIEQALGIYDLAQLTR